jgi:hypothetical protein
VSWFVTVASVFSPLCYLAAKYWIKVDFATAGATMLGIMFGIPATLAIALSTNRKNTGVDS